MKTLNFFNQDKAFETNAINSFQNDVLNTNEMFSIRGGTGEEETTQSDDDDSNGSTESTQEDNFN